MKRLLTACAVTISIFIFSKGYAAPLDVPYQIYVDTVNVNTIVLSTANFPSISAAVNNNVASSQWCLENLTVSAASASNVSIFWATSALASGTTGYMAVSAANVPLQAQWPYRDPICAPVGSAVMTIKSSVAGSTITAQGYLWKGWN